MKKDILIPNPSGVKLGIVQEEDVWDLYLINENDHSIRNILAVTSASQAGRETSVLRYFLESMQEFSSIKFESIVGEVIDMENSIFLTYYVGMDIYEKEFIFSKPTLLNPIELKFVNKSGHLID